MRSLLSSIMLMFASAASAQTDTAPAIERMRQAWAAYQAAPERPLDLGIRTQDAAAVRRQIGAAGGSLVLDTADARFTLTIPPDHLFYPAEISLTPIVAITGLGAGQRTLAVKIGPSDLALAAPAWLAVEPKKPNELDAGSFAIGFSEGGRNAHYAWRIRDGKGVAISVSHFSGFGLGLGAATNAALAQTKPRLALPNASRTQKDAAAISQADQGIMDAINAGLAGESSSSDGDLLEAVKQALFGPPDTKDTGRGQGRVELPQAHCSRIEEELKLLNVQTVRDQKNPRAIPRSPLTQAQLDKLKRCAEPPARMCFDKGNPWPLVRYLKTLRLFRPQPEEAGPIRAILAWIEGELAKCAAYEMTIRTTSRAPSKEAEFASETLVTLDVVMASSAGDSSKDIFTAWGDGKVVSSQVRCKVAGVACTVTGTRPKEPASLRITLADLPFDKDDGMPSAQALSPQLEPAFMRIDTEIRARGIRQVLPFEMNYAFWRCHYPTEFKAGAGAGKSPGLFQPKGWQAGSYPVLFELTRPIASKSCEGTSLQLGIELQFVHRPKGAFTPMP